MFWYIVLYIWCFFMFHMFSYFFPCRWREHFDSILLLAKHLKDWNCIHAAFVFASNHKHVANWEQCWVEHPMGVMNLNGRLMQILAIKLLKTIICDSNSFIIKQVIQPPPTSNTHPDHWCCFWSRTSQELPNANPPFYHAGTCCNCWWSNW